MSGGINLLLGLTEQPRGADMDSVVLACTHFPLVQDELEAAARTDPMLRPRLAPAQSAFDRNQVGERFLARAQAGSDPRFQTSRDLGRFLLEGLARGAMTYDEEARKQRLLAVVKRAVRALNRKGEAQDLWVD